MLHNRKLVQIRSITKHAICLLCGIVVIVLHVLVVVFLAAHGDDSSNNLTPSERPSIDANGKKLVNQDIPFNNETDSTICGFATLPRTPKKLSLQKNSEFHFDGSNLKPKSSASGTPSKSTPDLLRLYWGSNADASPKDASPRLLHRVNARRIKKDSVRGSTDDGVDDRCVVVVSDAGECLYSFERSHIFVYYISLFALS